MTAPTGRAVAIVAGSGVLPRHVARSAENSGHTVFLALIAGSARADDYADFAHRTFGLGQFSGLVSALKARDITDVAFIGGVIRPGLLDIKPDFGLVKHWSTLKQAFRKGDDGLLGSIIGILEGSGFRVISALDLAPDLAVNKPGAVGKMSANVDARADIDLGLRVIEALSPFDVGQCVVISDGRPVAIEGAEGTDGMLHRIADMRRTGRLRGGSGGGVLVKSPKRGQDMRIDIPTIGPDTLRNAAAAGLQGVAIASGCVLLAEREQTIALADQLGLFIEATP